MDSAASSSCGGAPSGFEAASVGSGLECGGSGGERGHKSGADSSGAAQGGAGAASGAVCRMRVDGQGMAIEAVVPGAATVFVHLNIGFGVLVGRQKWTWDQEAGDDLGMKGSAVRLHSHLS